MASETDRFLHSLYEQAKQDGENPEDVAERIWQNNRGLDRRTLMQAGALGAGGLMGGAGGVAATQNAAASNHTDSDGNVGDPNDTVDVFGETVDSNLVATEDLDVTQSFAHPEKIIGHGGMVYNPADYGDFGAALNDAIAAAPRHDWSIRPPITGTFEWSTTVDLTQGYGSRVRWGLSTPGRPKFNYTGNSVVMEMTNDGLISGFRLDLGVIDCQVNGTDVFQLTGGNMFEGRMWAYVDNIGGSAISDGPGNTAFEMEFPQLTLRGGSRQIDFSGSFHRSHFGNLNLIDFGEFGFYCDSETSASTFSNIVSDSDQNPTAAVHVDNPNHATFICPSRESHTAPIIEAGDPNDPHNWEGFVVINPWANTSGTYVRLTADAIGSRQTCRIVNAQNEGGVDFIDAGNISTGNVFLENCWDPVRITNDSNSVVTGSTWAGNPIVTEDGGGSDQYRISVADDGSLTTTLQ